MNKKPNLTRSYAGALLLIIALSGLAYGAQLGQDAPPGRGGSAADLPSDLEGNWLIKWDGEGRAWAVLKRHWELKDIEAIGGGRGYFNKVHETEKRWSLTYTSDLQNWGGTSPEVDEKTGKLEIKWGWGGNSELRQAGPNKIAGAWKYETGSPEHNKGGGEVWERAVPVINRVVFKIESWSWGIPENSAEWEWRRGEPPVRIESTYSGQENMRAARPQFKVMIYGDNLWGHHLIDVNGALDLEPLHEWRNYLLIGGGKTSALSAPNQVEGIEQFVVIWPKAQSGKYALRLDGYSIPFELVIKGTPSQPVNPPVTTGGNSNQPGSFLEKILPFLVMGLLLGVLYALGPVGWVIGAGLGAHSLWKSYKEGGWQKVWDDLTPHEFLDLIVNFEKLSGWQRLEKFLMGGGKVAAIVGGFAGGKLFATKALQQGKRAIQQGRRVLDAARIADRATRLVNGKPLAKLPHPGLSSPTPSSGRKLLQKNVKTTFENKKKVEYGNLPKKDRYDAFDEDVKKSVYGPLYSKPAGRQNTDLTVPNGKTYGQVHGEYVDKLPTKNQFKDGKSWRYHRGEAFGDPARPIKQRIWINADPNHSPGLMEEILKDMDGVNQAKIAKRDLDRVDSIVIYTDGNDTTERILKRLDDYQKKHPEAFRDGTPPTTDQRLRGVAVGDHPTDAMKEAARKAIAQRLDIDTDLVPKSFSYGDLRAKAHYFAEQDVHALKAKGLLNAQSEAAYREQRTREWYEGFGIDPTNPDKNLPKPKSIQLWPNVPAAK